MKSLVVKLTVFCGIYFMMMLTEIQGITKEDTLLSC